jgi:hypothetical protein
MGTSKLDDPAESAVIVTATLPVYVPAANPVGLIVAVIAAREDDAILPAGMAIEIQQSLDEPRHRGVAV